ncbi:MAG: L-serine ammonia-lyase, iron-sulfur-dependent, subunit alpha [Pseudobutyrivibrio sp.]|nr:L-serine ammonia-lyase, iron-sulfur-dependent, subunit alpha [Pseudobutyrivibrio sp.]
MYNSIEQIINDCNTLSLPMWKVIQKEDCKEAGISEEASYEKMATFFQAMKDSDLSYDKTMMSRSGLIGPEASLVGEARKENKLMIGDFLGRIMERALRVASCNACMKTIVAAPTAGSCGVVPAVLLTIQEEMNLSDDKMIEALYVVAGIGGVIASRATLSGAEGGCQAEIGSASAMAAGALCFIKGGSPTQVSHASALALKGLLGLACDPVAGLVEVPCVKRNVIGAINAVSSADMSLCGIKSKIPADEVFDAMRNIGHSMSADIRETGIGGLAGTNTGVKIRHKVLGQTPLK